MVAYVSVREWPLTCLRCVYARDVTAAGTGGRNGEVFDAVAESYDRERPSYPSELIDAACSIASLKAGSRVLEVGCGTGKLTEALVERRLKVDAVDPGPNMIALARERVRDAGAVAVEFHLGRFEEVSLPEQVFDAVFSAAAFHWIVPEVGWAKAARSLRPGGTLALITHISYCADGTAADDEALHEVFRRYWLNPGSWHPLRDLATLLAGVDERRDNVSAVFSWLGRHDLDNAEAASLFDDVPLTTHHLSRKRTADELWSLYETTSSYLRLDPVSREALQTEVREFVERRGGRINTSELAVLLTARRPNE